MSCVSASEKNYWKMKGAWSSAPTPARRLLTESRRDAEAIVLSQLPEPHSDEDEDEEETPVKPRPKRGKRPTSALQPEADRELMPPSADEPTRAKAPRASSADGAEARAGDEPQSSLEASLEAPASTPLRILRWNKPAPSKAELSQDMVSRGIHEVRLFMPPFLSVWLSVLRRLLVACAVRAGCVPQRGAQRLRARQVGVDTEGQRAATSAQPPRPGRLAQRAARPILAGASAGPLCACRAAGDAAVHAHAGAKASAPGRAARGPGAAARFAARRPWGACFRACHARQRCRGPRQRQRRRVASRPQVGGCGGGGHRAGQRGARQHRAVPRR